MTESLNFPILPQPSIGTPMGMSGATNRGADLDLIYGMETRQRALVVDDDPDTVVLLKEILRGAGFDVTGAFDCHEALKKVTDFPPNVILLDLMMPEIDGWQTFEYLREVTNAPVIMVSAMTGKEMVVRGLQSGADDYVTKPFFNAEVIARVNTVLRRARTVDSPRRYVFPSRSLVIDLETQEVNLAGKMVHLTAREYGVLVVLARHAPRSVPTETIVNEIWGEDTQAARHRIKYLIYLLRRKLETDPDKPTLIQTGELSSYRLSTK
ncbi:MAG: response regulator transcription factor [Anaerolineaceae bacterium]|nr:response regulator transcription factor [Anaerolineaceae bacterium]